MAKERLHGANVSAALQQIRTERMAKRVHRRGLGHACRAKWQPHPPVRGGGECVRILVQNSQIELAGDPPSTP